MKIKLDLYNSRGDSVFRNDVDEVILPTPTGPIVILPRHETILTVVETGLIRFRFDNIWAPFIAIKGASIIHRYDSKNEETHIEVFLRELQNVPKQTYDEAYKTMLSCIEEKPKAKTDKEFEIAEEKVLKARGIVDAITFIEKNKEKVTDQYVITRKF